MYVWLETNAYEIDVKRVKTVENVKIIAMGGKRTRNNPNSKRLRLYRKTKAEGETWLTDESFIGL